MTPTLTGTSKSQVSKWLRTILQDGKRIPGDSGLWWRSSGGFVAHELNRGPNWYAKVPRFTLRAHTLRQPAWGLWRIEIAHQESAAGLGKRTICEITCTRSELSGWVAWARWRMSGAVRGAPLWINPPPTPVTNPDDTSTYIYTQSAAEIEDRMLQAARQGQAA